MMNKEIALAALAVKFICHDLDHRELTVLEYLQELLSTLWREEEDFSGKRPFGNSGWQYDLVCPLVKNGFVPGEKDGDEYDNWSVDNFDQYHTFVAELIPYAFIAVE